MKKGINFLKLLQGYSSGWVAISSDFKKVVISGKTLQEVRDKTKETNEKLYFFPTGESYSL